MATSGGAASAEDRIGGYRVVRVLHAGSTALVMEVVDDSTHRRLAAKQLAPSRCDDSSERRKFAFEAKVGLELHHPNLIRLLEYVPDREPFFVMEYFQAPNLKLPLVKPTAYPMPKDHLHRIIRQAASGLAYMHDKGWIHRDVKPENILANAAGEVRVIDYNIALRARSGLARLFAGKVPRPDRRHLQLRLHLLRAGLRTPPVPGQLPARTAEQASARAAHSADLAR